MLCYAIRCAFILLSDISGVFVAVTEPSALKKILMSSMFKINKINNCQIGVQLLSMCA